ncbi:host attachment protein [Chelatococcus reniformis]|uniref:Host attachment protein n=1 Tax=Chelatococcus reniformis TaxID=1494448 RepID=A0A916TYZ6_9HYPH|nr:host attachment protein [Chelatococcus reniformis]GGC52656.1 hypothetical protein GCM10010994_09650 [Chelatococcus reniformis]
MKLRIPHDAWIVVCDGRKALFLRNAGDATYPNLTVECVREAAEKDRTAALGTDRPGRLQNGRGPTSAVEGTDWHTLAEQAFAEETAREIEARHAADSHRGFVLAAPPKTLAVLRAAIGSKLGSAVLAEVDKDLTRHPTHEIERLLTAV